MKIEVTQCSMCTHYNTEQYCEVWEQYITNDAFYCACGVKADRKTEPSRSEKPNNCEENEQMRRRTPSEIKAYGDGYTEAYKEFCHLLKNHDVDKAMRKMKIFADAVVLTVETATDEPQTDCSWR